MDLTATKQLMIKIFQRNRKFYQFYSRIHYTSCVTCLELHGKVLNELPAHITTPLHEACMCSYLTISRRELKFYREHGKRMEERARLELARRALFQRAIESIKDSPTQAFQHFQQAVHVEIYLGEVEDLFLQSESLLQLDPEFTGKLYKLFINANRFKYDTDKYGHMPPAMKLARIQYGESRLRELFRSVLGDAVEAIR